MNIHPPFPLLLSLQLCLLQHSRSSLGETSCSSAN